jgi:hypothetical protein
MSTDADLHRRAMQRADEVIALRRAGIASSDERRYNEGRKHWDTCPQCSSGQPCATGQAYL